MADGDFATEAQINALVTAMANGLVAHRNDTSDAHDASAISVLDTGTLYTATDVEAALAEVRTVANAKTDDTAVTNHINDTSDAHDASAISVLDTGGKYTATDVEAALAEVKTIADDAVYSATITTIVSLSQASYDALGTKDANTLYIIV